MDYDELTIFVSGFLTASVFTWIMALLMTKREKPPCGTRFTGDQIAMQEHFRLSLSVQGHLGIVKRPGSVVGDGGVHQGFDLTHGVVSFELRSV